MKCNSYGVLSFAFLIATTTPAFCDENLIQEVEILRNSLLVNDPSRPALTLRLADLMFDESVALGHITTPTKEEEKKLRRYQSTALQFYQEALEKQGNSLSRAVQMKIKFQKARLYSNSGNMAQAQAMWRELVNQDLLPDIKRESALRLAETAENNNSAASLAQAEQYYQIALKLCDGVDLCAFVHYRRAWNLRNQHKLNDALAEIQQALWDAKGQPREEALRDFIVFLASDGSDGQKSLKMVDELASKLSRPQMLIDLSSAYFSAGNKQAGVNVLEIANARKPTLKYDIRLLEESYGLRQWERFRNQLTQVQTRATRQELNADVADVEKVLRRLTVQLDAERITQKQLAEDFKNSTLLYLKLFPDSKERMKVMDGWIAAEIDNTAKLEQLHTWITSGNLNPEEVLTLREKRAAIAQSTKSYAVAVEEMSAMSTLTKDAAQQRKYRYHQARALYEQKSYDTALPIFQELAAPSAKPDQWAVQSQNLALDILGQKKNYAGVVQQANAWVNYTQFQTDSKLTKELTDMRAVAEQAEFENAVSLGATPQALALFQKFCMERKVLPKSCDNGKVVAAQLKDQKALLAILKAQDLKHDLASEYEASGFFSEAAHLLENNLSAKGTDPHAFVKVALLYELAGQNADRDRLLNKLLGLPVYKKSFGKDETLVFETIKDAGLLAPSHLSSPWTPQMKAHVANELTLLGKATPATEKVLLTSTAYAGKAWSHAVLTDLQAQERTQAAITFYGKNGKKNFEHRLAALKKVVSSTEKYFSGADSETRVAMSLLLSQSHKKLAQEILESPMPEGLPEDALKEVKANLTVMANPFSEKAAEYDKILHEQMEKITDTSQRSAIEAKLTAQTLLRLETPTVDKTSLQAANSSLLDQALKQLHDNPANVAALTQLKNYYSSQGQARLASYFQGRILQLQKGVTQ